AAMRRATLLSMDPERWEWSDRPGVLFQRPGHIVWPKDLVPAMQTADVTLQSDRARTSLKMMYEMSGSSWAASYRLYLGANGRIEGIASIGSGSLQLPDAEVQLMSGDIGYGAPPGMVGRTDQNATFADGVPRQAYAMAAPQAKAMNLEAVPVSES